MLKQLKRGMEKGRLGIKRRTLSHLFKRIRAAILSTGLKEVQPVMINLFTISPKE